MAFRKRITTKTTTVEFMTTAINIRKDQWILLGDVAHLRRQRVGNCKRSSISELIRDLIDENKIKLMREVNILPSRRGAN